MGNPEIRSFDGAYENLGTLEPLVQKPKETPGQKEARRKSERDRAKKEEEGRKMRETLEGSKFYQQILNANQGVARAIQRDIYEWSARIESDGVPEEGGDEKERTTPLIGIERVRGEIENQEAKHYVELLRPVLGDKEKLQQMFTLLDAYSEDIQHGFSRSPERRRAFIDVYLKISDRDTKQDVEIRLYALFGKQDTHAVFESIANSPELQKGYSATTRESPDAPTLSGMRVFRLGRGESLTAARHVQGKHSPEAVRSLQMGAAEEREGINKSIRNYLFEDSEGNTYSKEICNDICILLNGYRCLDDPAKILQLSREQKIAFAEQYELITGKPKQEVYLVIMSGDRSAKGIALMSEAGKSGDAWTAIQESYKAGTVEESIPAAVNAFLADPSIPEEEKNAVKKSLDEYGTAWNYYQEAKNAYERYLKEEAKKSSEAGMTEEESTEIAESFGGEDVAETFANMGCTFPQGIPEFSPDMKEVEFTVNTPERGESTVRVERGGGNHFQFYIVDENALDRGDKSDGVHNAGNSEEGARELQKKFENAVETRYVNDLVAHYLPMPDPETKKDVDQYWYDEDMMRVWENLTPLVGERGFVKLLKLIDYEVRVHHKTYESVFRDELQIGGINNMRIDPWQIRNLAWVLRERVPTEKMRDAGTMESEKPVYEYKNLLDDMERISGITRKEQPDSRTPTS